MCDVSGTVEPFFRQNVFCVCNFTNTVHLDCEPLDAAYINWSKADPDFGFNQHMALVSIKADKNRL